MSPTDRTKACPICASSDTAHQRRQTGFNVSRCRSCGSDFAVLTASDLPSYDEHYEQGSIYTGYHKLLAKAKSGAAELYWYQPRMIETAGPGDGRVHLDIGSGLGTFSGVTKSHGWKSYGQDVSPKAAHIAREAFNIETFLSSIDELPLAPGTVHWISAFEVLEHVLEPRQYARRFRDLLAPGGLVTISVPNGRSRDEQTTTAPLNSPPTHINFFTRRALNRMFEEHGFDMIYDYEKPIAWGEIHRPKWQRALMLPLLVIDSVALGHRGNRLLWVGRKRA